MLQYNKHGLVGSRVLVASHEGDEWSFDFLYDVEKEFFFFFCAFKNDFDRCEYQWN